jgi:hypothetical protein
MANTNCLEGIRCPKCGQEEEFFIEGTQLFRVNDDGAYGDGDIEWDDESRCSCSNDACEFTGDLGAFRIEAQEKAGAK